MLGGVTGVEAVLNALVLTHDDGTNVELYFWSPTTGLATAIARTTARAA
mgnify:CR=1 FL=1